MWRVHRPCPDRSWETGRSVGSGDLRSHMGSGLSSPAESDARRTVRSPAATWPRPGIWSGPQPRKCPRRPGHLPALDLAHRSGSCRGRPPGALTAWRLPYHPVQRRQRQTGTAPQDLVSGDVVGAACGFASFTAGFAVGAACTAATGPETGFLSTAGCAAAGANTGALVEAWLS